MRRVLFAGTPDFALPSLMALAQDDRYTVVAVLTQPDKPVSRKKVMTPPPVKVLAQQLGIPVLQYDSVRKEGVEAVRALDIDVMVTAAYGQIISQEMIDIPRLGVINVHGSLLPRYRGACPIQMAMINGDKETGITIMRTALKVDSGDMLLQRAIPIEDDETLEQLFDRMAILGADALMEALDKLFDGTAVFTPQDSTQATYCHMLTKEDGKIDWNTTGRLIDCKVRGFCPWPSAWTVLEGKRIKVWQVKVVPLTDRPEYESCAVGSVVDDTDKVQGIGIRCADGVVWLVELQQEGSKRMSGKEYVLGHKLSKGAIAE